MKITIDPDAGFCFGVVRAIDIVDEELNSDNQLYCLGHIVHNSEEVARMEKKGLNIIEHDEFNKLKNSKVIIRAHGEPLSTYTTAKINNMNIIDATCPIVIRLQKKIKEQYELIKDKKGRVVIFGKPNHPEVIGLNGQTENNSIIINSLDDVKKIDFSKPIRLFSQTTMDRKKYKEIAEIIKKEKEKTGHYSDFDLKVFDSICNKVTNRTKQIREFAKANDIIVFVSDKKSSNGKHLFNIAKSANERSYFISNKNEIHKDWFKKSKSVGISGATSTPAWLMEDVANEIKYLLA